MTGVIIDVKTKADSANAELNRLNLNLMNIVKSGNLSNKALGQISAARFKGVTSETQAATKAVKAFGTESRNSVNSANSSAATLARTMNSVKAAAAGAVVAFAAFKSTQGLLAASDGLTNIQNRLKLVSGSMDDLARRQKVLFKVAQSTQASYAATANTFVDFSKSLSRLGASEADVIKVVKTINQAGALSGSSIESLNAAMIQLQQGISAGALRGEEFNSVAEQNKYLMLELAKATGKTVGELRQLAFQGQLTSDVLFKTILKISGSTDKAFNSTVITFSKGTFILKQSISYLVGELAQFTKISEIAGNSVVKMSARLDNFSQNVIGNLRTAVEYASTYLSKLATAEPISLKTKLRVFFDSKDIKNRYQNEIKEILFAYSELFGIETKIKASGLGTWAQSFVSLYDNFIGKTKDTQNAISGFLQEIFSSSTDGVSSVKITVEKILNTVIGIVGIFEAAVRRVSSFLPKIVAPAEIFLVNVATSIYTIVTGIRTVLRDALRPTVRDIQGIFEGLTMYLVSDTRIERAFVKLFQTESLETFTSQLFKVRQAIDSVRLGSLETLLFKVGYTFRRATVPIESFLISINLLDNSILRLNAGAIQRIGMSVDTIVSTIKMLYTDVIWIGLKPILANIAVSIVNFMAVVTDIINDTFDYNTGKWIGSQLAKGFKASAMLLKNILIGIFKPDDIMGKSVFDRFVDLVAKTLIGAFKNVINFTRGLVAGFFSEMNFSVDLFKFLNPTASASAGFKKLVDNILGDITGRLATISKKLSGIFDFSKILAPLVFLKDLFSTIFKYISESIDKVFAELWARASTFSLKYTFSLNTTLLEDGIMIAIRLFESIYYFARNSIKKTEKLVESFTNNVKDMFFDVYDKVVGHSYWPDMISGINMHTRRLNTSEGIVKRFIEKLKSAFKELGELAGPVFDNFGSSFGNLKLAIGSIDYGQVLVNLRDRIAGALVAGLLIGFGGMRGKLLGFGYLFSFITDGVDKAILSTLPTVSKVLGQISADFTKYFVDSFARVVDAVIVVIPKTLDALIEGIFGKVTLFFAHLNPILSSKLLATVTVIGLALASMSRNWPDTISSMIFGEKNARGKVVKEGVLGIFKGFTPAPGEGLLTKLFGDRKEAAALGVLFASTMALESVSVFEALFTAAPLMLYALLGPDAGARLLKDVVTKYLPAFAGQMTLVIAGLMETVGFTSGAQFLKGLVSGTGKGGGTIRKLIESSFSGFSGSNVVSGITAYFSALNTGLSNFRKNSKNYASGAMSLSEAIRDASKSDFAANLARNAASAYQGNAAAMAKPLMDLRLNFKKMGNAIAIDFKKALSSIKTAKLGSSTFGSVFSETLVNAREFSKHMSELFLRGGIIEAAKGAAEKIAFWFTSSFTKILEVAGPFITKFKWLIAGIAAALVAAIALMPKDAFAASLTDPVAGAGEGFAKAALGITAFAAALLAVDRVMKGLNLFKTLKAKATQENLETLAKPFLDQLETASAARLKDFNSKVKGRGSAGARATFEALESSARQAAYQAEIQRLAAAGLGKEGTTKASLKGIAAEFEKIGASITKSVKGTVFSNVWWSTVGSRLSGLFDNISLKMNGKQGAGKVAASTGIGAFFGELLGSMVGGKLFKGLFKKAPTGAASGLAGKATRWSPAVSKYLVDGPSKAGAKLFTNLNGPLVKLAAKGGRVGLVVGGLAAGLATLGGVFTLLAGKGETFKEKLGQIFDTIKGYLGLAPTSQGGREAALEKLLAPGRSNTQAYSFDSTLESMNLKDLSAYAMEDLTSLAQTYSDINRQALKERTLNGQISGETSKQLDMAAKAFNDAAIRNGAKASGGIGTNNYQDYLNSQLDPLMTTFSFISQSLESMDKLNLIKFVQGIFEKKTKELTGAAVALAGGVVVGIKSTIKDVVSKFKEGLTKVSDAAKRGFILAGLRAGPTNLDKGVSSKVSSLIKEFGKDSTLKLDEATQKDLTSKKQDYETKGSARAAFVNRYGINNAITKGFNDAISGATGGRISPFQKDLLAYQTELAKLTREADTAAKAYDKTLDVIYGKLYRVKLSETLFEKVKKQVSEINASLELGLDETGKGVSSAILAKMQTLATLNTGAEKAYLASASEAERDFYSGLSVVAKRRAEALKAFSEKSNTITGQGELLGASSGGAYGVSDALTLDRFKQVGIKESGQTILEYTAIGKQYKEVLEDIAKYQADLDNPQFGGNHQAALKGLVQKYRELNQVMRGSTPSIKGVSEALAAAGFEGANIDLIAGLDEGRIKSLQSGIAAVAQEAELFERASKNAGLDIKAQIDFVRQLKAEMAGLRQGYAEAKNFRRFLIMSDPKLSKVDKAAQLGSEGLLAPQVDFGKFVGLGEKSRQRALDYSANYNAATEAIANFKPGDNEDSLKKAVEAQRVNGKALEKMFAEPSSSSGSSDPFKFSEMLSILQETGFAIDALGFSKLGATARKELASIATEMSIIDDRIEKATPGADLMESLEKRAALLKKALDKVFDSFKTSGAMLKSGLDEMGISDASAMNLEVSSLSDLFELYKKSKKAKFEFNTAGSYETQLAALREMVKSERAVAKAAMLVNDSFQDRLSLVNEMFNTDFALEDFATVFADTREEWYKLAVFLKTELDSIEAIGKSQTGYTVEQLSNMQRMVAQAASLEGIMAKAGTALKTSLNLSTDEMFETIKSNFAELELSDNDMFRIPASQRRQMVEDATRMGALVELSKLQVSSGMAKILDDFAKANDRSSSAIKAAFDKMRIEASKLTGETAEKFKNLLDPAGQRTPELNAAEGTERNTADIVKILSGMKPGDLASGVGSGIGRGTSVLKRFIKADTSVEPLTVTAAKSLDTPNSPSLMSVDDATQQFLRKQSDLKELYKLFNRSSFDSATRPGVGLDDTTAGLATEAQLQNYIAVREKFLALTEQLELLRIGGFNNDALAKQVDDFRYALERLPDVITKNINAAREAGKSLADGMNSTFKDTLKGVFKGEKGPGEILPALLNEFTSKMVDTFVDNLTEQFLGEGSGLYALFEQIGSGVAKGSQTIGGGIAKRTDGPGFGIADMLSKFMSGGSPSGGHAGGIKPSQNLLSNALNTNFAAPAEDLANITSSAMPALSSHIGESFPKLTSSVTDLSKNLGGAAGTAAGGAGGLGVGMWGALGGIFGTLIAGMFAGGGKIVGPGTGTSDSILAGVSNGEFIVNAASTKKYGRVLEAINSNSLKAYAEGGYVGNLMMGSTPLSEKAVTQASRDRATVVNLQITGDISRQTRSEVFKMLPAIANGVNGHNREQGVK